MLTSILRVFLTRSFYPFIFRKSLEYIPDLDVKNLGLYVHIPFCKDLCSFCPYYKVQYERKLMKMYVKSLLKEIDLVAGNSKGKRNISSIYFGGGSPALVIDFLPEIMAKIRINFNIAANIGIELHPRDINLSLVHSIGRNGFDMVSIGVQSFQKKCLSSLGRNIIDSRKKIKIITKADFRVINIDLIFGIPGQKPEDLIRDFEIAAKCGATQISTYPFIEFSYSGVRERPLGREMQKKMMDSLMDKSMERGFKRASVWTFIKKDGCQYSSVTRDNYYGFGPSAASLTKEHFKINTFSVKEYIKCLANDKLPTSLTLRFSKRRRALYWLFWSAYNLYLNRRDFRWLFDNELDSFFKFEIFLGKKLGLIKEDKDGYKVTEKGALLYHLVEQVYTHQYIDKTWRTSIENPWPEKLVLY